LPPATPSAAAATTAGDVNGRALLTHQGRYQARPVGDIIAGKAATAWADHRAVPRVTFTDPQVAAVGMTEAQARQAGIDVRVVTHDIGSTAAGALAGGLDTLWHAVPAVPTLSEVWLRLLEAARGVS